MVRLYHTQPLLKLVTIQTISCSPGLDSLMEVIHQGNNLIGEMSFIKDKLLGKCATCRQLPVYSVSGSQ